MIGKISYIGDTFATVNLNSDNVSAAQALMNMYVIFEDQGRKIVGEIENVGTTEMKVKFLGEFRGSKFIGGVIQKPSITSTVRMITEDEFENLIGQDENGKNLLLGYSPLYNNHPIKVDINDFFSNHMAVFGNTGSGKSCGIARILQNIFSKDFDDVTPVRSNFFIFDAYGEYHNAFKSLESMNPNYHFKYYTTNKHDREGYCLKLPLWLLGIDDIALLLGATEHSQLPIIERMLKLVRIFAETSDQARKYQNHLIAKAIMTILYTNQTASSKRNDIFSIFTTCSTPEFNLESTVQGVGYTRKFRECFIIDKEGNFTESILVTKYISSFIDETLEQYEPTGTNYYTMKDLEKALEFTLISEGLLRNEKAYGDAITLKVRLHSLAISDQARFFDYPNYISLENYISSLVAVQGGGKAQIVNFNLEDIDDGLAKTICKIYTRMLFDFTKRLKARASIPFHLFLEESHRYVQNDTDKDLIGYNIFERVAKEGRKYGLMFNLISQRPVEISETVISQCSNFLIFKMNHPRDLEYIEKMLPNISKDIVEKQKSLQPGTCVAFGKAFKIPMIIHFDMPSPEPQSSNCDVASTWQ